MLVSQLFLFGVPDPINKIMLICQTQFNVFFPIEQEYQKLKEFYSKYYNMVLEEQELCVKGWNWGTPKFNGMKLNSLII